MFESWHKKRKPLFEIEVSPCLHLGPPLTKSLADFGGLFQVTRIKALITENLFFEDIFLWSYSSLLLQDATVTATAVAASSAWSCTNYPAEKVAGYVWTADTTLRADIAIIARRASTGILQSP